MRLAPLRAIDVPVSIAMSKRIGVDVSLVALMILVLACLWPSFLPAKEPSRREVAHVEDFEERDPFIFWTSDGSFVVNGKGLTEERRHGGKRSFYIDVTLKGATYAFWMIPVRFPVAGSLTFRGHLYVESAQGATVALGTHYSFPPFASGPKILDCVSSPTPDWLAQESDVVREGKPRRDAVVKEYAGEKNGDAVGAWLDRIGLFIQAPKGGRIRVFVDDIELRGTVPDPDDYRRIAEAGFKRLVREKQSAFNARKREILSYVPGDEDPDDREFASRNIDRVKAIGSASLSRGYVKQSDLEAFEEILNDISWAKTFKKAISPVRKYTVATFPWVPITPLMVLPHRYPIPARLGGVLTIRGCRGEFEPASFVLRAGRGMRDIRVETGEMALEDGTLFPSGNIDIQIVKAWYKDGRTFKERGNRVLIPELLLHDDGFVIAKGSERVNWLKVESEGVARYANLEERIPTGARISDSKRLLPFTLGKGENRQIWVTAFIPLETAPGKYHGKIRIRESGHEIASIELAVEVLPFELAEPGIEYAMYYRGKLSLAVAAGTVNSEWKTAEQYARELANLKNHGIRFPTFYQVPDERLVDEALSIRNGLGFPRDRLYILGTTTSDSIRASGLVSLISRVKWWKEAAKRNGYEEIFIYGIDEASGERLRSQRKAWELVHAEGGKLFVACSPGAEKVVGDLLDIAVVAGKTSHGVIEAWHSAGKRVFSYANPHVGEGNPDIYRRNYGFLLWVNGYDGAMPYVYHHASGHIWNDFDGESRDLVFAYPTVDGVVDTIQWEGFREGIDDVRYLTTYIRRNTKPLGEIREWIRSMVEAGSSMDKIRNRIIQRILSE